MLKYYYSYTDENGYVHALDKAVLIFNLKVATDSWLMHIVEEMRVIRDKFDIITYDEKLDLQPRSDFSWCKHFIHFAHGLPVFLGCQRLADRSSGGSSYTLYTAKIEFNPNYVFEEYPYFLEVINCLMRNSFDFKIKRLDYCIDIPVKPEDIVVVMSRKQKRNWHTTRYYGTRSHHMALKIYDKRAEQSLESNLTRIEYTVEHGKEIKFDKILILDKKESEEMKYSTTQEAMIKMCLTLKELDYDYLAFIKNMQYRQRKIIIGAVEGSGTMLVYNDEIYNKLVNVLVDSLKISVNDLLDEVVNSQENEEIFYADNGYNPFNEFEFFENNLTNM